MSFQLKPWQLPLITIVLIAVVLGGLRYWRGSELSLEAAQRHFPVAVETLVYVNVAALERAGYLDRLAGPPGSQESDYVRFVEESGFDYRRDLRSIMVGLASETVYGLATGDFDWRSFRRYAETRGGICRFAVCRVPRYGHNRVLSWAPLRNRVIAFASSTDEWGAVAVIDAPKNPKPVVQSLAPVWLATTGKALRSLGGPDGLRAFTRSLEGAQRILLTASPNASGSLEARLVADCPQPADAQRISRELTEGTIALTALIEREHKSPNPADLSGVLVNGRFSAEANRVVGSWQVPAPFIDALLVPAK